MPQIVGVVSIQGDFQKHMDAICSADPEVIIRPVKTGEDLAGVDRLIIPGGESTTVGMLMQRFGLAEAILDHAKSGVPIWGTCMGMILLSRAVEGSDQFCLGLLDIVVRRNAFGAQVHSFEDAIQIAGISEPVMGVFIRAPVAVEIGGSVEILAKHDGKVVAVRQGAILGTSFHPELTDDHRLHSWFLSL